MPRMPPSKPIVDTLRRPSVSFAPAEGSPGLTRAAIVRHDLSAIDPSRPARDMSSLLRGAPGAVTGIGVQSAKVQRPLLRPETLARFRLLDWLHVQIHHRILLVIAEAGYGKTTLLADFSGRTRLRTMWYRIEEDDRDWVTFLSHLVAAGRVHDPEFAATTAALLADTGVTAATLDTVLNTFIAELPPIAEHGAALILDDYHLVDDAPDIKLVVREIVARAPERLTIVFSSRRSPGVPLGKLRAGGEVAELRTDDLRFDRDETARLFAETYGRPLEPDILADLADRTEGWAASLQLVQAALRDRSPNEIRRMVRNLTGADHELYDYLAEEVVGDLSEELQQFLMRTSILQAITPELAAFVTELTPDEVRTLIAQAERVGLLSRRGETARDSLRYHPLVGDFLRARLERSVGPAAVEAMHRAIADAVRATDWRRACHHYSAIGAVTSVADVLELAIEEILATGETAAAGTFLPAVSAIPGRTAFDILRSRLELRAGDPRAALKYAMAARTGEPSSAIALMNLASVAFSAGDAGITLANAAELARIANDSVLTEVAEALLGLARSSVDGNLRELTTSLRRLSQAQLGRHESHYAGVTELNLGVIAQGQADPELALSSVKNALGLLGPGQAGSEVAAARLVKAWALMHGGKLEAARQELDLALADANELARVEACVEGAEIEAWYGDDRRAAALLARAADLIPRHGWIERRYSATRAELALRRGDYETAASAAAAIDPEHPTSAVGFKSRILSIRAHIDAARGTSRALESLGVALRHAETQEAWFWVRYCQAVTAALGHSAHLNEFVVGLRSEDHAFLSLVAERIAPRLDALSDESRRVVDAEAEARPERWRDALRHQIEAGGAAALVAARLLDRIGERDDIPRLRHVARTMRKDQAADLGRGLARRLAPRIFIEDQGRIVIRVGDRPIEGTAIRRKVLAFLAFLLTKPRFSAAREEVLDALWPDSEPSVALNSLNQTVYFLRRVLEPGYVEDLSPGYVRHESDLVWLDRQLVSSRSQLCADLIRALGAPAKPEDVERLATLYQGPFALDFAYEEWAAAHRDTLHAAYLQIIERAVAADTASGHFDRGIALARRALEIDPAAERIEVSLLRLLRMAGAHAAAAEQYEHYATVLRDQLGLEPLRLEDL